MKTTESNYHNLGGRISAMAIMVLIISLTAGAAIKFSEDEKPILEGDNMVEPVFAWAGPSSYDQFTMIPIRERNVKDVGERDVKIIYDRDEETVRPDTLDRERETREAREKERQEAIKAYKEARMAERLAFEELREALQDQLIDIPEDIQFDYDFKFDHDYVWGDSLDEGIGFWKPGNYGTYLKYATVPELYFDALEDFKWNEDSLGGLQYQFFADSSFREQFEKQMKETQFQIQEQQKQLQEKMEQIRNRDLEARISRDVQQRELQRIFQEQEKLLEQYELPEIPDPLIVRPYDHVTPFLYQSKTEKIMKQELLDDGLIERGKNYIIELNDNSLIINGEKQPKSVFKKYKRLYESMEGEEMVPDTEFRLIL